ncbi:MAG: tryptophan--tRNA ligase [Hyphomicrobiales bacterium]
MNQSAAPVFTPRVLSGMQPTGNLHLGNYLGAMLNWIKMQETHETLYCVVDLHAITQAVTVWGGPNVLRKAIRDVTAAYIACGLDPKKSIIFNQSRVPEHAELAWVFNCVARLGWLDRMTQFKEKAGKDKERASVGLYDYPVLMAADILIYKATAVPVGDDQKQHLELTRDIATKFNIDFADSIREQGFGEAFFPITDPVITGPATRVMSLRDGTKKMSKSDPSDLSRINLTDSADDIAKKIRKAKTDADGLPSDKDGLKGRPEAENLVGIYAALAGISVEDVLSQFGGGQFSGFKNALADLSVAKLAPISGEMNRLLADPGYVEAVLEDGAKRASAIAGPIMRDVKKIMGFI